MFVVENFVRRYRKILLVFIVLLFAVWFMILSSNTYNNNRNEADYLRFNSIINMRKDYRSFDIKKIEDINNGYYRGLAYLHIAKSDQKKMVNILNQMLDDSKVDKNLKAIAAINLSSLSNINPDLDKKIDHLLIETISRRSYLRNIAGEIYLERLHDRKEYATYKKFLPIVIKNNPSSSIMERIQLLNAFSNGK